VLAGVGAGHVALAATLSVVCFVLLGAQWYANRQIGDRLGRLGLRDDGRLARDRGGRQQPGGPNLLRRLGGGLARRSTRDRTLRLRTELARAGMVDRLSVDWYLGLRAVAVAGGAALGGLLLPFVGLFGLLGVLVGAALGYWFPRLVVSRAILRRRKTIERALPDAIDMLVVSLEAGLSFDGAVAFLSDRTEGDLVNELRRYLADLTLGRSRREALLGFVERVHSDAVRQFATAVIHADELGTGLSRTLRAQARALRTAQWVRAEEQARRAPVKLLFPLVLCILPVLLMVVMGPAVLEAMRMFGGN
jgi:tight adherence protein C